MYFKMLRFFTYIRHLIDYRHPCSYAQSFIKTSQHTTYFFSVKNLNIRKSQIYSLHQLFKIVKDIGCGVSKCDIRHAQFVKECRSKLLQFPNVSLDKAYKVCRISFEKDLDYRMQKSKK